MPSPPLQKAPGHLFVYKLQYDFPFFLLNLNEVYVLF